MKHLVLTLEAPMMALGGEVIDNLGIIRDFLSISMLTGLLANALGWHRTEQARHQQLQDRLIFAARIDREPSGNYPLRDFQTVQLGARDQGWTTRGIPDTRTGGAGTYESPHLRFREYWADMSVTVALRLQHVNEEPTIDDLAKALHKPARPLFIGRKTCLPSKEIFLGLRKGMTVLATLLGEPLTCPQDASERIRMLWPEGEGDSQILSSHTYLVTDQRNWLSGLHGGGRTVCEGTVDKSHFPILNNEEILTGRETR